MTICPIVILEGLRGLRIIINILSSYVQIIVSNLLHQFPCIKPSRRWHPFTLGVIFTQYFSAWSFFTATEPNWSPPRAIVLLYTIAIQMVNSVAVNPHNSISFTHPLVWITILWRSLNTSILVPSCSTSVKFICGLCTPGCAYSMMLSWCHLYKNKNKTIC